MRKKLFNKAIALLIVLSISFSLFGCSADDEEAIYLTTQVETQKIENNLYAAYNPLDDAAKEVIPDKTVTLNVYSELANEFGEQEGWFGQIIEDMFNVKLYFLDSTDPEIGQQIRNGEIKPDIIVWGGRSEQPKMSDQGIILDWEKNGLLEKYGSFMSQNMSTALEANAKITGGSTHGIGFEVALNENEFAGFSYHPDVRWDLYQKLGCPKVDDLEDYVDLFKSMKEIYPESDSGKETYAVSFFPDWDGSMVMYVKSTATNFFGVDEFLNGLYDVDTKKFQGALQRDGYYLRCLKFYNTLYREGLLDPESRSQTYSDCYNKFVDGQIFSCIFGWLGAGAFNSAEHQADGELMAPLACTNQDTVVYGLNTTGDTYTWTIGAYTEYPQLCMALINWLATPDGFLTTLYGPKGLCWDYDEDNNTVLLDVGYKASVNPNYSFDDASGFSGMFQNGISKFNCNLWAKDTVNPEANGQTYNTSTWPNITGKQTNYAVMNEWLSYYGVETKDEYMKKFEYSVSAPHTYVESETDDDFSTKRDAISAIIRQGTWDAIYAESEAEYNEIVNKMIEDANNAGYEEVVAWGEEQAKLRAAAEAY